MSSRIIIIGGGTAGISIAARLRRAEPGAQVTIIDPAERHYYQPLWTLVGGGLAEFDETDRSMLSLIPEGVVWLQQEVASILPDENKVVIADGKTIPYDALVVVPGIRLAFEEIAGLEAALKNDPKVWTNYAAHSVQKGKKAIAAFTGGKAWFTFPNSPVKCGGGPQKIMWIAETSLRKNQVREKSEVHFVAPGGAIFGVPKYRDALQILVE